jgi:hypothetical protein
MYYSNPLIQLIVCALWAGASARKPEVTLGLNTANSASRFGGLEPHASWSTGARLGEVNLDVSSRKYGRCERKRL